MMFFAYGTLLDPDYQRALLGTAVPTEPATLDGWSAVFTESGYLTLLRQPGAEVRGALVTVDDAELAICDAWEEVPLYERVPVEVVLDDGTRIASWAYIRAVESGEPAPPGELSRMPREAVIAAIRQFRATGAGHATNESST
jgi:gamma-glutamylcyclotransferase (GGCT)/AIG2-like uncharacterized protein YtfP